MAEITSESYPGEFLETDVTSKSSKELGKFIKLRIMSGANPVIVIERDGKLFVLEWIK